MGLQNILEKICKDVEDLISEKVISETGFQDKLEKAERNNKMLENKINNLKVQVEKSKEDSATSDYLAPSAERVKKERKTKPSKQRKEPAGKVREKEREVYIEREENRDAWSDRSFLLRSFGPFLLSIALK